MTYPVAAARGRIAAASGPNYLVRDQFTDTNGTLLAAHVPDVDFIGGGWVLLTGGASISSNRASVASGGAFKIDGGIADFTLTVPVNVVGATGIGVVMFRYTDESNYWWLRINVSGDTFDLYERTAATNTQRDTVSVALTAGVDYTVALDCSGDSIAATLDGANDLSYSSATRNDKTVFGLRAVNSSIIFDDFFVTGEYP